MPKTDKRVDEYIAKAPEFAKPILTHLRALAHEACPDCEETLKWSAPAFMQDGILFIMAAFKEHCAVNFWKAGRIIPDADEAKGAGQLGTIRKVSDLPSKKLMLGYIRAAAELNAQPAAPATRRVAKPKKEIAAPDYFTAALAKNKKANAAFEAFPPSHKREYLEWITEAKTDATRDKRLAQAIEWIAEGKSRNWKYK